MKKVKADASKVGLASSDVEGQGTTNVETGQIEMDSSRRKKKK